MESIFSYSIFFIVFIWNCINIFRENPSYKNKEILVSLVASYDLNQHSHKGLFRTTEYEVARINSLFLMASVHQIYVLKVYLYELIGKKTRIQKMASWISEDTVNIDIPEFNGLIPQLKLYYNPSIATENPKISVSIWVM